MPSLPSISQRQGWSHTGTALPKRSRKHPPLLSYLLLFICLDHSSRFDSWTLMVIFLSFPHIHHIHIFLLLPEHLSGTEVGSLLRALEDIKPRGGLTGPMPFPLQPSLPVRCFRTSPLPSPPLSLAGVSLINMLVCRI